MAKKKNRLDLKRIRQLRRMHEGDDVAWMARDLLDCIDALKKLDDIVASNMSEIDANCCEDILDFALKGRRVRAEAMEKKERDRVKAALAARRKLKNLPPPSPGSSAWERGDPK